jgi:hypothetical protein
MLDEAVSPEKQRLSSPDAATKLPFAHVAFKGGGFEACDLGGFGEQQDGWVLVSAGGEGLVDLGR